MSIRKLAGLFFIVMGLVQIFHALSDHTSAETLSRPLYAFVTALLFTIGAALIWWNGKWRSNGNSHTSH
ncbi:MAG TPA: hypothetical protein VJ842_20555 [Pyrinomonadaceae bacterium]|nr:hypothetical protein [Pyrinomonadaceae bacterium]